MALNIIRSACTKFHAFLTREKPNFRFAPAVEAAELRNKLVSRFRARVLIALQRTLMHALYGMWEKAFKRARHESGLSPVSFIELRFQGSGGAH